MQNPKIIVAGAGGQLGLSIKDVASHYQSFDFIFLSKDEFSVANEQAVNAFFEKIKPDFCINCAAYIAVDAAESNVEEAFAVNAVGAAILATACYKHKVKFIHISTDYVFNGTSSTPYLPECKTDPVSVYGKSKAKGEELALSANPETIIIRTSWVYSEHGKNFVKTMLRLMREKQELNVVNDQEGAPTYAKGLANAILTIVESGVRIPGIFHYCNTGRITWYEFAITIKELTGSACQVSPIPTAAYPTPAKRPVYSLLDTSSITNAYGIQMLLWKESLEVCIRNLQP